MTSPKPPALSPSFLCTQVFILRVWYEDIGDGQCEWRASVKHNITGEMRYFRDWQLLTAYLQEKLRCPPNPSEHPSQA